jgi:hypothetical protein
MSIDPIPKVVDDGQVNERAFGGAGVSSPLPRGCSSSAIRHAGHLSIGKRTSTVFAAALVAFALITAVISSPAVAETPKIKKPGAPTAVQAIGVNTAISVSWTAPTSDGGSPITGYVATTLKKGGICTTTGATSCVISGLTNKKKYTVSVRASNARGGGASSAKVKATPSFSQNCSYFGPYANLQYCDLKTFV